MRSKVFLKYLISSFVLASILITAIGILISINTTHNIEKQIAIEKTARLRYIMSSIEEGILKPSEDLILQCNIQLSTGSAEFLDCIYEIQGKNIYSIRELYNDFNSLIMARSFIESINICIPAANAVVSSRGYRNSLLHFDDAVYVGEMADTGFDSNGAWTDVRKIDRYGSSIPVFSFAAAYPVLAKKNAVEGFIYLNIRESDIRQLMEKGATTETENVIVLNDRNELLLSLNPLEPKLVGDLARLLHESGDSITTGTLGGERVITTSSRSNLNGWTYVVMTPVSIYFRTSKEVQRDIIIVCGAVLLLGFTLSYLLSSNLYNPIKMLSVILDTSRESARSTVDDFSLITGKIREMNATIQDLNRNLKENVYLEYLRGKVGGNKHPFPAAMSAYSWYLVLVLKIGAEGETLDSRRLDAVVKAVNRCFSTAVVSIEMSELALILNVQDPVKAKWLLKQEIGTELKMCFQSFNIYVGNPVQQPENLYISYENARQAARYRFIRPLDSVILYAEIADLPSYELDMSQEDFCALIKGGNRSEIRKKLVGIRDALSAKQYSIESIEYALLQMMVTINSVVMELKKQNDVLASRNIYAEFTSKQTLKEAMDWIAGVCDLLVASQASKSIHYGDLFNKMKDYIDSNLDSEISLDMLSEIAFLSPSYISSHFKDAFGMNLCDYINTKRLVTAAELLASSDKPMKDIIKKVGFSSLPYFIKKFKQKYGTTPHLYRLDAYGTVLAKQAK